MAMTAAVVAALAVVAMVSLSGRDPKHKGRQISEYADELGSKDKTVKKAAQRAISESGADAVPYLINVLKNPDETLKHRSQAALGLGLIGGQAKDAVPHLIKAADDPDFTVKASVIWALARIPAEPKLVIPVFVSALESPSTTVRVRGLEGVGRVASASKETDAILTRGYNDPERSVRLAATNAWAFLHGDATKAPAPPPEP